MIDILLLLIIAAVTWAVASEGPYGAGQILIAVIFSGLLAMNFFEPLAIFLERNVAAGTWSYRWDVIALVGLFTFFVFMIRLICDHLMPTYVVMEGTMHEVGRWLAGLLTGYVTAAFLLTALHTAPLPRNFIGFKPERPNFFGAIAPDRQWLGFTQYVSERSLAKGGGGQFARVFDGPRLVMGDEAQPYPNEVWPSFPIRYAARREEYALGGAGPSGDSEAGGDDGGVPAREPSPGDGGAGF